MAIDIEQEIKYAKRLKQIEIYEFNEDIDPYDVLLDYEYAVKILQSNSETILKNHTFNYKFNNDKKSLIESYECFRRLLTEQEDDFYDQEEYIDFIIESSLEYRLNELINAASIILMYKENFNDAFYFFNVNLHLNNDNFSRQYINKIEGLNEFIFKYNMVLDLIRLKNYDDALNILNEYYIKNWRTHEGDILLLLLNYQQNNQNMCSKIINSINGISGNSMLLYELNSELKTKKIKTIKSKPIVAALILLISLGCVFIYRGHITKSFNSNTSNKKPPCIDSSLSSYNDKNTIFNNKAANSTDLDSMNSEKNNKKIPDNSLDTITVDNTKENKAVTKIIETPIDKRNYSSSTNSLDQLETYLSRNDINSLENSLKNIQVSTLSQEDKKRYDALLLRFKPTAESYYYEKGKYCYYNSKDYSKSTKYFMESYKYLSGIYLDQHVLFLLGQSIKNQNPMDSVKYYREYIDTYKSGCYIELALYNLSTIYYSNNNISEAKTYAQILENDFANSKYINKTIKTILQN